MYNERSEGSQHRTGALFDVPYHGIMHVTAWVMNLNLHTHTSRLLVLIIVYICRANATMRG